MIDSYVGMVITDRRTLCSLDSDVLVYTEQDTCMHPMELDVDIDVYGVEACLPAVVVAVPDSVRLARTALDEESR